MITVTFFQPLIMNTNPFWGEPSRSSFQFLLELLFIGSVTVLVKYMKLLMNLFCFGRVYFCGQLACREEKDFYSWYLHTISWVRSLLRIKRTSLKSRKKNLKVQKIEKKKRYEIQVKSLLLYNVPSQCFVLGNSLRTTLIFLPVVFNVQELLWNCTCPFDVHLVALNILMVLLTESRRWDDVNRCIVRPQEVFVSAAESICQILIPATKRKKKAAILPFFSV